jgi:type I restriction enzyme S subunit
VELMSSLAELERFRVVAGAPNGVQRLRELVLQLAVQGKLVPQDPTDEPASELLKRIAAEKERLIGEGKIKRQKPLPAITEEEKPFELPKGWEWVRLGAVAEINPRNQAQDDTLVSFIPMALISTFTDGRHSQETKVWSEVKQGFTHFAEGDIGVAKITPCFENGKAAIFSNLKNGIGAGTTELHVVRPFGQTLVPRYILIYLKSPQFLLEGESHMTGTAGQKRLPKEFVASNPFPLPPYPEQIRIIERVDRLMSLCDQLEVLQSQQSTLQASTWQEVLNAITQASSTFELTTAWQRLEQQLALLVTEPEQVKGLRDTILQLAVQGKLVPQDPNDEPASVLLTKIQAEKERLIKAGKIKRQKPLPPITDEEKPFELPKGWEWVRLGDLAQLITSGSRDWAKYYSNKGAIFVRMGNLSRGHYNMRLDSLQYVVPPEDKEGARTKLEANDILISITGDVGMLGLVPPDFGEAYINQHTCLVRFVNLCRNRYFPEFLRSPLATTQFTAPQRGIKNSFRLSDISEMLVSLPPEQHIERVVFKIDAFMSLCDQLEARLQAARQTQAQFALETVNNLSTQ